MENNAVTGLTKKQKQEIIDSQNKFFESNDIYKLSGNGLDILRKDNTKIPSRYKYYESFEEFHDDVKAREVSKTERENANKVFDYLESNGADLYKKSIYGSRYYIYKGENIRVSNHWQTSEIKDSETGLNKYKDLPSFYSNEKEGYKSMIDKIENLVSDKHYKNGGQFNNKGFTIEELDEDLKEVYQNRAFKNISGSDFFFSRLNIYPLQNVFTIELPNGEEIGRATLNEKENYLTNIRINENYRRKGLALNLYDYIEYIIGKKLKPSPDKISIEAQKLWLKRNPDIQFKNGGRTISQTPSPNKDRIYGSNLNKKSSSKNLSNAKLIKFDEKTIEAIKNKVAKHNEEYPNKKINLASAKAVVRRGFGAYSSSHRPTISGGKPNSRVAWGLARLNAFIYKIVNGKSKSGKYSQDDDLIEELGYKVADYKSGGKMEKDIRCINCGWEWNKKDSELWDMYVCHKCGFDNTTFYTSIPINNYSKGGETKTKSPDYLKMFLDL